MDARRCCPLEGQLPSCSHSVYVEALAHAVLVPPLPSGEEAGWRGCREGRSQQKGLSTTEEACGSSYFAIGSDIGLSTKVNLSHMTDLTFAVIKSIIIQ